MITVKSINKDGNASELDNSLLDELTPEEEAEILNREIVQMKKNFNGKSVEKRGTHKCMNMMERTKNFLTKTVTKTNDFKD